MRTKIVVVFACAAAMLGGTPGYAKLPCAGQPKAGFEDTVACYRQAIESQPLQYTVTGIENLPGLERRTYRFTSQSWSPDQLVTPARWEHEATLYIPEGALPHRALVIANNGTRYPQGGGDPVAPNDFDPETLASVAKNTRTVVVSVSDIPNQFLTYADDGRARAEDDSVAHSWSLFMQAPQQRATLPLHVPMAAAVWRAMTLAERELRTLQVDRFIVSGISKRAWISWLAAIGDPRVDAIAPFAVDLLSTRDALKNMYRSYGGNWPLAFYPYYAEGIDRTIDTPAFGSLLEIEDPLAYLGTRYGKRLKIPKYVINASGDDFFVPDNAGLYFDRLPGAKALRMVPNSSHAGIRGATLESLTAFVNRIQRGATLPELDTKLQQTGHGTALKLKTRERPKRVVLWQADNPDARDFRYACGIRYTAKPVGTADAPPLRIPVEKPASGWRAVFVEATFDDGFVATSQAYILGDGYPTVAPPVHGDACKTLPGRGFAP
ncbi:MULTISPECIES: PhoPQ-activated pathogenicity-related family protein [Burkholderia]|nr:MULTISPECIES: PhoPQ-activated protein PqaA family protein [Burkholderia]MCC5030265.1 PhoPQ-regulated protein [Burkholderia dolosa]UEB53180.1 PhoPQ-regulated protein [Burkholderia dolosa]UEC16459.1 PhoPQ-regulated protein [Burkholderia dolosa]